MPAFIHTFLWCWCGAGNEFLRKSCNFSLERPPAEPGLFWTRRHSLSIASGSRGHLGPPPPPPKTQGGLFDPQKPVDRYAFLQPWIISFYRYECCHKSLSLPDRRAILAFFRFEISKVSPESQNQLTHPAST